MERDDFSLEAVEGAFFALVIPKTLQGMQQFMIELDDEPIRKNLRRLACCKLCECHDDVKSKLSFQK